jgi:hypothetical protein
MAAKNPVTVSVSPTRHRPSSAERRAAQIATISTQQADLKREAAERAAKRALSTDAPPESTSRRSTSRRRSNAR